VIILLLLEKFQSPIRCPIGHFEIVQNCARKIVRARKIASNWESSLRENSGIVVSVAIATDFIGKDYGTRVGDFPAILFRIFEFFALKISICILPNIIK
jgi:hypothetical protein